jgi:hypothetical protein
MLFDFTVGSSLESENPFRVHNLSVGWLVNYFIELHLPEDVQLLCTGNLLLSSIWAGHSCFVCLWVFVYFGFVYLWQGSGGGDAYWCVYVGCIMPI